ncbi:hypothetical protein BOX15_Mlig004653g1 [Macrostomum lignano]|uniref:Cysteine and tyrosine-rich protein 1 n=1 Tax=Macrostomum lignano TaxID=282301 RepID=A0A267EWQ1_9PLAT|nr:hypothetical protein BOX15_Mlig004653g3 [Macrostomum lignano]PAA65886.1 hypothetical protein BOX15_Mlig004653g1 [Macrostomum lignano]
MQFTTHIIILHTDTRCIAGAIVGALVFIGVVVTVIVVVCCVCKSANKRSVRPATTGAVMTIPPPASSSNGAYPTNPQQQQYPAQLQMKPPNYSESQMYPPVAPGATQPDTAYPPGPPPAYPPQYA